MAEKKETPAEQKEVTVPKLDPKKTYTVIGTGANRHMAKGTEHIVGGADATIIIKAGRATLKG